jgi:hypothetical protein
VTSIGREARFDENLRGTCTSETKRTDSTFLGAFKVCRVVTTQPGA